MTKLYYAEELKEITEQNMSEDVKHLLKVIADTALMQAKSGDFAFVIKTKYMHKIKHIVERKGYKVKVLVTQSNAYGTYEISWD